MKTNKIAIFALAIILSFVTFTVTTNASENEALIVDGAGYYEESVLETNDVGFGVKHNMYSGYSKVSKYVLTSSGNAGSAGSTDTIILDKYYTQRVNVMEINTSETTKVVPWGYIKGGAWSLKTVKEMASNYEEENPGWKVVGCINGDFFDISGSNDCPYTPLGSMISDGQVYKAINSSWPMLEINNTSESKKLKPNYGNQTVMTLPFLSVYDSNDNIIFEYQINKVNQEASDNEVSVHFAVYNKLHRLDPVTITNESAFIVNSAFDTLAYDKNTFYGLGIINARGKTSVGANSFAIISNNSEVSSYLAEGVKIRVQYKFNGSLGSATNAIGFKNYVLSNEEVYVPNDGYGNTRYPRTIIGEKKDGTIMMLVVDGRQAKKGYFGMTEIELSAVCKYYGFSEAYQLDGGGSTTMAILDGEEFRIVNSPSDSNGGDPRSDSNCLLVVTKVNTYEFSHEVTDNSVEITLIPIDVLDKYKEIYIQMNGEKKQVVNNKVKFDKLKNYTVYPYQLYVKVDDEFYYLKTNNNVTTAKLTPYIYQSTYDIQFDKNDIKKSILNVMFKNDSSLRSYRIKIGDLEIALDGKYIVLPENVPNLLELDSFEIIMEYDLLDGKGIVEKTFVVDEYKVASSLIHLNYMKTAFDKDMTNLFK